jgi:predicted phage terminase large subunit-like protein
MSNDKLLSEPPSFGEFARRVFPDLEMRPFHENYYRLLEAFTLGKIRRLIVTIPPQHGKSTGASVLLPAYLLGLDPDRQIAIASYSKSLASRFNRQVQRLICSEEYAKLFPATTIKGVGRPRKENESYVRTSEQVDVLGHRGGLISVGRGGPLTGNRVDILVLDDLYKNSMEANSPTVRDNCWDWYTSVVRTRMHNDSSELIVFTRWHPEDLIGAIAELEEVTTLRSWNELEGLSPDTWLHLNLEALKDTPPTLIDPRRKGEALWPERQSRELLLKKQKLDPAQFECMYQGHPSAARDLLYGEDFATYNRLPDKIVKRGNYTDTADMGDDFLCSVCYVVDEERFVYVTDIVYTTQRMEVTERMVAEMIMGNDIREATIESNNGGRGFARAVQTIAREARVGWFHQTGNKEARILSNSATVLHKIRMPEGWNLRWPEFYTHLTTYRRKFRSNRWHDAPDVLTGIIEKEMADTRKNNVKVYFK